MKVYLVNSSPREKSCTYTALCEVEKGLKEFGIDTEFFWLGNKPIIDCIACGTCFPALFWAKKKGAPSLERPQSPKLILDFGVNTAA